MISRAPLLLLAVTAATLAACALPSAGKSASEAPGLAPPTPVDSSRWTEPPKGYLPAGAHPDGRKIMPPPPAEGSPRALAERAEFEATRALKDTPRWTQAIRDADLSGKEAFHGFSCAAGVKIGPTTTPTLAKMMLRLIDDARPVYNPAKDLYGRTRPPIGNTAPICVPRERWLETNASYPSGHSLIAWTWTLILAELIPDRSTEIAARGREFGDSRMICGVHWSSDVEAGRLLAGPLVARLHAEPGFMADMATAKAEIEKARTLGAPEHCPVS